MVHLKHSALVCILEGTLEIFGDFLLTELSLNSIDYSHYSFNITVKYVTFLKTLKSDLALLGTSFSRAFSIIGKDCKAFVSYVVHDWRGALI